MIRLKFNFVNFLEYSKKRFIQARSIKHPLLFHSKLKSSTYLIFSTLSPSRYKSNMKQLQNLIFDQPISSSVERATWWIEYVIRHEGTKHLNNDGYKTLSWYKYLMIDVLFAVFFGMLAMLFGFVYVIHKIRNYSKSLPFEKVTRGSKCKVL